METNVEMAALLATDPDRTERNRTINHRWSLGAGVDHYDKPAEHLLTLSVSHDSNRKTYYASVRRETQRGNMMMTSVFAYLPVATTPVARYSAKSLDTAAEQALQVLRGMADDPRLLELAVTGEVTR